jgi:hypothetical protein
VSAAVGAVLGLADVAMHSCICSVTGVCTLADKSIHSYICSVTSVCIYSVYKHVAPTFSDRYQSSTIDLLFCSTLTHYRFVSKNTCLSSDTTSLSKYPTMMLFISFSKTMFLCDTTEINKSEVPFPLRCIR